MAEQEDVDEEWLLAQPMEELQEHCVELGVSDEGSAEELAARIVNKLEDLEEVDEEEEGEEEEDGGVQAALREQLTARTGTMNTQPRFAEDDDDDGMDSAGETLERLRAERAAGRRELGSVENERLRASLSAAERVTLATELKEGANLHFRSGANDTALGAYLAAIWLLKPHEPP